MIIIKDKVFIQLEPKVEASPNDLIKVRDVASIFCENKVKEKDIENILIYKTPSECKSEVLSVINIINIIHRSVENIDIVILGNPEILIDTNKKEKSGSLFNYFKIAIVSLILLLGGGLTIIYFHEDVSMDKGLQNIYYTLTGVENSRPLMIQVPYSFGIGIGMISFFNHFVGKRRKKEPSPLEVEMYLYDKNIDDYVLDKTKHNKN